MLVKKTLFPQCEAAALARLCRWPKLRYSHTSILMLIQPFSFSYFHSHSHTSIPILILPYSFSYFHTHSHTSILILILPYSFSYFHTHSHTSILILILPYSFSYFHTHSHTTILILIQPYSFSYNHSHWMIPQSHSYSFTKPQSFSYYYTLACYKNMFNSVAIVWNCCISSIILDRHLAACVWTISLLWPIVHTVYLT